MDRLNRAILSRIERYSDRARPRIPDIGLLEPLLTLPTFLLQHGRLPRKSSNVKAGLTDFLFERKHRIRDSWIRACCDKAEAKLIAQQLSADVKVVQTRAVIDLGLIDDGKALEQFLSPFRNKGLIAKTTHSSGGCLFPDHLENVDLDAYLAGARIDFFRFGREKQYMGLPARLIVEDLIPGTTGSSDVPPDYKFFCSRGTPFLCQVDTQRFSGHRRDLYVLPDVDHCPVTLIYENAETTPVLPNDFRGMLSIAAELSRPFDFVRVDLYATADGVFFGEFTFTPDGGVMAFSDEAFNRRMLSNVRASDRPASEVQARG